MSLRHIYNAKELDNLFTAYKNSTLVVNFFTDWSSQCHVASQEFECLSRNPVCRDLVFAHCHAELLRDIALRYKVHKVPTVLFLKEGKLIDKLEGFDPNNLQKKVLYHAAKLYQCTYHLNLTPSELCERMNALLSNSDLILFIDNYHSNTTWEFYAMLDSMCATYDVFNVNSDLAVQEYLKNCWKITTFPQLFMFGHHVGNFEKVRMIKSHEKCRKHLKTAIAMVNAKKNSRVDVAAFAGHRVKTLLTGNVIVVFLEEDEFRPCNCETKKILHIVKVLNLPYATFNVLDDIHIRSKVMHLSKHQCFPQIFIHGQFVGNSIFLKAFKNELSTLFS
ncbi:hypothetical protein WDU94_014867 [Cyamophila willieti]